MEHDPVAGDDGIELAGVWGPEHDIRLDRLRRGEPMTPDESEAEWTWLVDSARRLASTASRTAAAWAKDAEIHRRIAVLLANSFPDQARKHRDRAAASERLAAEQREIAAGQLFRARRLSMEAHRRTWTWRHS
jgi:hypothetical protein